MTANEATSAAWKAHRRGRRAFWMTVRAVYLGYREHGYGHMCSFWQGLKWSALR